MQGLGPDGTYSLKNEFTDPFLRDLIDLAVIVDVPTKVRHERTAAREQGAEGFLAAWHAVWDDVESYYFERVCPPRSFDLVIQN